MPPCLDVYVVTRLRDLDTLNRFVQLYVDRQASNDRGDEQLMMLPLGAIDEPRGSDQWDWEPARDLGHVMRRALDHPRRAFAFYLKSSNPGYDQVVIAFTSDNQTVFGVSIDDPTGSEATLASAKACLRKLASEFGAHAGYVGWELPPPLITGHVPPGKAGRVLFSWQEDAV